MVKINDIHETSTFAWSYDSIPILATGTAAGVIDDDFSSSSSLSFYNIYDKTPILKLDSDAKFNDLDWSKSNELLVGALENGSIQFWNTKNLIDNNEVIPIVQNNNFKSHSNSIKSIQFSKVQTNVLASGGNNGEIFIYDTNKLKTNNLDPFPPGIGMTPMDTVNSVAWNNNVGHIFASAGSSGYTAIWDLRAKKELIHLSYTTNTGSRATLSTVAWHPSLSTKLATASEADGAPVILTWDLRNSNAPETILTGHKKGILSLDWNSKDSNLLLSSGKDNTTILWNPITSEKLTQYPTTASWVFKSRFAPSSPDIFASSSFDKKISIQTLQDTSPPISNKLNQTSENDFWNNISEVDTQQPEYFIQQAPNWYGRSSNVSFGFGGKIVTVAQNDDKHSEIKISKLNLSGSKTNVELFNALNSNDFKTIVETRINDSFENINKSDWEILNKLNGESNIFDKFIGLKLDDKVDENKESKDEDFFNNLKEGPIPYVPNGQFKLFDSNNKDDEILIDALLTKDLNKSIEILLKQNKIAEALIVSQKGPESLKQKILDYYFAQTGSENSISRLLYSISLDNVEDLVENGDIDDWKRIGNAIKTYSSSTEVYNAQFVKLGDRILSKDPIKNRNDAILTYINAKSLDKVANIWVDELKSIESKILETNSKSSLYDAHFDSLNEFVEKFSAYRSILNLDSPIEHSSPVLSIILQYTSIISTSGQFELAKKFLSLLPDSIPAVKLEKERIDKALGIKSNIPTTNVSSNGTAAKSRYGSLSNNVTNNSVTTSTTGNVNINRGQPAASTNPYFANANVPVATSTQQFGQPPLPQIPPQGSPYAPQQQPHQQQQPPLNQFGSQQSINPYKPAAIVNPYKPQEIPQQQQQQQLEATHPPQGPPKSSVKRTTDGWNDLPSHFHQAAPARRPTPSASSSTQLPSNGTLPNNNPVPPQGIRRNSSFANPPQVPPPPRSVSRSSKSAEQQQSEPVNAPPVVNSRYTPAQSPEVGNVIPSSSAPPQPAPRNPYAPTQQQLQQQQQSPFPTPVSSFPPPINAVNSFGPPPSVVQKTQTQAPANPYAPTQAQQQQQQQNPSVTPSQAPTNPYAPQQQQNPSVTPSQAPTNPYAPQQQQNPSVTPSQAPTNPYAPQQQQNPSVTPSQAPTNPYAPQQQQNPSVTPSQAPTNPYAPQQQQPQHSQYGIPPSGINRNYSAPPIPAPPTALGSLQQAQQPGNLEQASQITAAAAVTATPEPVVPKFPPGDREHIPESELRIFKTFSSILDQARPQVPVQFSKQINDTEKRLNILYDHLNNEELLTPDVITQLHQIVDLLESKNYPEALQLHIAVMSNHTHETAHWGTGLKRLIQFAEATN
ncbi:hypothetical protein WICMUC_000097 [Wickerhamomyces mucosus]|uniref:Protein transport protein SEC31 n=1 Tax=Wickerhamomyces mucosus TaxID=1378264 RepID=A0A9P8Q190_9ASCO|nr:hypothetical protein WICMUC_000097 [Wickerhamomyces mucosus]